MSKYKVLLVEDDETVRRLLEKIVRKEGFEVLTAENGQVGLEIFQKELPDIVITDLKMPEVDGLEVLHTVRRLSPNTQVIVVTAFHETDSAIVALREGALDYIKKPIDLDSLILALGRAKEKIVELSKLVSYPTILVVEDDETNLKRLTRVLEKENWQVFAAADGEKGFDIFKKNKIDIALLDIKIPKKDGLQLFHDMRKITTDFETIIFSGYGDEKSAVQAMRDGASNFLKKPLDLDQVIIAVERTIEKLITTRALKYRTRELELTREVVAKITADKKIVVDVRNFTRKDSRDFAQCLLDAIPMGLIVVNEDMQICYMNKNVSRRIEGRFEKLDENFAKNLSKVGIHGLSYRLFMSAFRKVLDSPPGLIETVSCGQYAYITLSSITVLHEETTERVVLIATRGERK